MDDILSLVLVFLFYAIAAASGRKKKKRRRDRGYEQMSRYERQTAQAQQSAGGEAAAPAQQTRMQRADMSTEIERNFAPRSAEAPCHQTPRLHLHEVTDMQMEGAGEGDDPCHAGSAALDPDEDERIEDSPVYDEEIGRAKRSALAQDMLRGVGMSEILKRPCRRGPIQRNGRMG